MICWCSLAGTEVCQYCKNNTEPDLIRNFEPIRATETIISLQEINDKIRELEFYILT